MSEQGTHIPPTDDSVDEILAEVLGTGGADLAQRYSGNGASIPVQPKAEEPVAQPTYSAPRTAAPQNTAQAEPTPEQISEDYRAAAARYEVNGYRISAPQAPYPAYQPYAQYPVYPQPMAYPPYPVYPQPVAYPPYPAYTYPQYPAGYEYYGEYPQAQQPAQPEQPQQTETSPYAAAAGSRVVYDADWANGTPPAPQSAPPAQQPAQPAVPVLQQQESGRPFVNPAFIDPLSADEDETGASDVAFADRRKAKAPQGGRSDFFPEGFSAARNNAAVADGKTTPTVSATADSEQESALAAFSDDYDKTVGRQQTWMMTDEELQALHEQRRQQAQAEQEEASRTADTDPVAKTAEPVEVALTAEEQAEALRRAEAEQIIAERFTAPTDDITPEAQGEESADGFTPVAEQFDDTIYEGESDLYYNTPNEEETTPVQETEEKKGNGFVEFLRRNTPHKGQTKREFISCLIMDLAFVVLIGGLIFCGIYFGNYQADISNDEQLGAIYEPDSIGNMSSVELDDLWADIRAAYPDIEFPEGLNPEMAKLYAVNQDVVGWLSIDNLDLETVVLQANDNDYYLYRNTQKESTKYGTPFADYRNDFESGKLSRQTIIYGHNTHDGLKFHNLTQYMKLDAYKKAPVLKFNTIFNGQTYWKIFAICLSDATSYEFEYLYTSFSSESSFSSFVKTLRAHSMYDIDVDVQAGDNLLLLYTCYQNIYKNGRLLVFARQVRPGEDMTVDTASATVNRDCIYPAAYYGEPEEPATTAVTTPAAQNTTKPSSGENATQAAQNTPAPTDAPETPTEQPPEEPSAGAAETPTQNTAAENNPPAADSGAQTPPAENDATDAQNAGDSGSIG